MISQEQIYSIIDVGTNNVLLLIASLDQSNSLNVLHRDSSISALGKEMKNNFLTESAIERVKVILDSFITTSRKYTNKIYIIGTSCSREAKNITILSDWLQKNYSINYTIISGKQEALLNGLANLNEFNEYGRFVLFDIGGGSTEFTLVNSTEIVKTQSLQLGIRRLINQWGPDIVNQKRAIKSALNHLNGFDFSSNQLIGIGGTATSLAAIEQNLDHYESSKVHGFKITYPQLLKLMAKIEKLDLIQLSKMLPFDPKRADIILTGTLIVKEILDHFNSDNFLISDRGLQFGFLYNLKDPRIEIA